jgi:hypothetical protein
MESKAGERRPSVPPPLQVEFAHAVPTGAISATGVTGADRSPNILDEEIALSLEKLGQGPEDEIPTGEAQVRAAVAKDGSKLPVPVALDSVPIDVGSSSILLPADSAEDVDAEDLAELVDVEEDSDTPPDGVGTGGKA